jgi:hypothetical protein
MEGQGQEGVLRAQRRAEVLICCSRADRELARAIGALVKALGHSVWCDPEPSIQCNEDHNRFILDLLVGEAMVVVGYPTHR